MCVHIIASYAEKIINYLSGCELLRYVSVIYLYIYNLYYGYMRYKVDRQQRCTAGFDSVGIRTQENVQ